MLGICGGLQMLGRSLADPLGVEVPHQAGMDGVADIAGLGLLDVHTRFDADKLLRANQATFADVVDEGGSVWPKLAGITAQGYEIRHGRTHAVSPAAIPVLHDAQGHCLGWRQGPIMGVYLHGLFESDAVLRAWLGGQAPCLDRTMDGLADFIDQHIAPGVLMDLLAQQTR